MNYTQFRREQGIQLRVSQFFEVVNDPNHRERTNRDIRNAIRVYNRMIINSNGDRMTSTDYNITRCFILTKALQQHRLNKIVFMHWNSIPLVNFLLNRKLPYLLELSSPPCLRCMQRHVVAEMVMLFLKSHKSMPWLKDLQYLPQGALSLGMFLY